ncbi:5'-methylthioadenosine/S-adenosylhomocysteine nucleosidase [Buchnera aphidicola]|nr:5'-methylthioadenosine/S-adenosylhomocysteine nucleosidase [Buchnera aphidicola]
MLIGIIGAMKREISYFIRKIKFCLIQEKYGFKIYIGMLYKKKQ